MREQWNTGGLWHNSQHASPVSGGYRNEDEASVLLRVHDGGWVLDVAKETGESCCKYEECAKEGCRGDGEVQKPW